MINETEIPANYQQKCLCVFVLDVSGSMRKDNRIGKLNEALAQFYDDIVYGKNGVAKATVGRLEVAIITFDQEPKMIRPTKDYTTLLLSRNEPAPILTERGSTTETVKALDEALEYINKRKNFYLRTGQSYHRPWIVLMTDGKSTSSAAEIDFMEQRLKREVANRHLSIIGIAIGDDVPMDNLKKLSAGHAYQLDGLRFSQFFQWLSNSFSTITQSSEGDNIDISRGADEWMFLKHYKI